MATQAQLEANRQNAQKSTGPKTEAGKAKSSQNALTHGLTATGESLLPHEAQSSYYRFHQEMIESLHPVTGLENRLVHRITDTLWRLQRIPNAEAQLFSALAEKARDKVQKENEEEQAGYERELRWKKPEDVAPLDIRPLPDDPSAAEALAQAFLKKDSRNPFMRLQRYEQCLNRTLHRDLHELRELQRERAKNPRDEHGQLLQERVEILQEKAAYFCDRSLSLQKQLEHLQQAQEAPRQNEPNSAATPEKTSPSRTSSPEKPAPTPTASSRVPSPQTRVPLRTDQGQMTNDKGPMANDN
jgi:hypothetical protein